MNTNPLRARTTLSQATLGLQINNNALIIGAQNLNRCQQLVSKIRFHRRALRALLAR